MDFACKFALFDREALAEEVDAASDMPAPPPVEGGHAAAKRTEAAPSMLGGVAAPIAAFPVSEVRLHDQEGQVPLQLPTRAPLNPAAGNARARE